MAAAKSRESAVLFVTDTHIGKKTSTYNLTSAVARLEQFAHKVRDIRALLGTGYEFEELVVCMLGDMIDGTGIYPTQSHHQDETGAVEQIEQFSDALYRMVSSAAEGFPRVRVEAIPGNHGRVSKFAKETDNWDILAYHHLAARFAGSPKVTVRYGGRNPFIRPVRVRRHTYLLYHGHGIKMHQQIPWYGLFTRLGRWATSRQYGRFDAFACGHFHTCGFHPINRVKVFMNGTAVTSDEWALEQFGYESSNEWWMVGSSDRHVSTFQFPLTV